MFDEAKTKLGIEVIFYLTGTDGHFNKEKLTRMVPDYQERQFYISGSHGLVTVTENLLSLMGIDKKKIKTYYFPGFV